MRESARQVYTSQAHDVVRGRGLRCFPGSSKRFGLQALLGFDVRRVPALCPQCGCDVVASLGIYSEITVSQSRGALDGNAAVSHAHFEVIHEGLATVEEPGKVANAGLELQARVALVSKGVDSVGVATQVHLTLPGLWISIDGCFELADSSCLARAGWPLPRAHLRLVRGQSGPAIVGAGLAGRHVRRCCLGTQQEHCRCSWGRQGSAAAKRRDEGWQGAKQKSTGSQQRHPRTSTALRHDQLN
mmetsp:Transcript_131862/g.186050  ORF Transcript_131862/g.186050 Transcript_131862/m.186050 type:complete len:244 (+) Transcript_131862:133-864(+)